MLTLDQRLTATAKAYDAYVKSGMVYMSKEQHAWLELSNSLYTSRSLVMPHPKGVKIGGENDGIYNGYILPNPNTYDRRS